MRIRRDEHHRYFLEDEFGNERQVVSITRTLIENNMVDDTFYTDAGRGRGRLVHFLCEHLFMARLGAMMEVPPHVSGYLVAVRRFLDDYGPTIAGTEVMRGSLIRQFAGTEDLDVAKILGGTAVIDIKTGAPSPWHGLQTAAQAYLDLGPRWMAKARYGLYITPTGGYRLKQHDDPGDLQIFFNALENVQWRIKYGSHERPFGRRAEDRDADSGDRIVDDEAVGDWRSRDDDDPAGDGKDSGVTSIHD